MSTALRSSLGALALGLLLSSRQAAAHDPFEITAAAVVDGSELALRVTMTRGAAERLEKAVDAPLSSVAFATRLFRVESGAEVLRASEAASLLTAEGEVEATLKFDSLRAAGLRFEAMHLKALPEGYLDTLIVRRSQQASPLARKVLQQSDRVLELQLPELSMGSRKESLTMIALAVVCALLFAGARSLRERSVGKARTS
ncbi:MAG: hypothetical protein QM756_07250 [Polyangiaceae bacterium]